MIRSVTSESNGANRVPLRGGGCGREADQVVWVLEYVPDGSYPPANTYSCITYGTALPGYEEKIPALPLTPERLYSVTIKTEDTPARAEMYFIIRLDSVGRPVKLEYISTILDLRPVQVITQP